MLVLDDEFELDEFELDEFEPDEFEPDEFEPDEFEPDEVSDDPAEQADNKTNAKIAIRTPLILVLKLPMLISMFVLPSLCLPHITRP